MSIAETVYEMHVGISILHF